MNWENDEFKKIYRCGTAAAAFSFIGAFSAMIVGIVLLVFYFTMLPYCVAAGIFMLLASVLSFVTFGYGLNSVRVGKKRKSALICTVTAAVSATVSLCLIAPVLDLLFLILDIFMAISGAFGFAAFILYAIVFGTIQSVDRNDLDAQIENGSDLQNKKDLSLQSVGKRKLLRLIFIPLAAMAVIIASVIPGVYFGNCNSAYNQVVSTMGSMSDIDYFCGHMHSPMSFLERLPQNYKDVATIKQQLYLSEDYFEGICSSDASERRNAYRKFAELQRIDPRWNFDRYKTYQNLLYDGMWVCNGYYLKIDKMEYNLNGDTGFETDLPKTDYDRFDIRILYGKIVGTDDDGNLVLGYVTSNNNMYYGYKISNLDYSAETDKFSIKVYCFVNKKTYVMTLAE